MTCNQKGCTEEATHIVHWPGQSTSQCEKHTNALIKLGKHMGLDVVATAIVVKKEE